MPPGHDDRCEVSVAEIETLRGHAPDAAFDAAAACPFVRPTVTPRLV